MAQQENLKTTAQRTRAMERMIRVNQAGEFGAKRIYAGQLAVMGDRTPAARSIAHMAEQEERHLSAFDKMMAERGVRPTALHPIWNVAGFALGAVSAAIGPEAAMACTVAVETEIDRHYSEQLAEIGDSDPELSAMIMDFQADELEHKATALAQGAERAPAYPVMSALVRMGCRTAIAVSKHI
ncbi:demethoxyubiquinone hydroxylase family protein [Sphingorhabdus sp.]|jgi:ubiquinone biosynthesis monooxygenase Coq7|uniref:demethoxyubiquinone hydroxylase family protein n=1 Tax=Sphingorhabdus sp. TaxID=1902408 RepID=UPI002FD8B1C2